MTVLMPNDTLGVRRRGALTEDALGSLIPGGEGPLQGPWPGFTKEGSDGRWVLGVDPAAWPVRQHDVVESTSGRRWTVDIAQLATNVADPTVNWIRCEALEIVTGGTEPGGPQFVGRD